MIKLKKLIQETLTWNNRKFGERLPTMEDYKEAHNKKSLTESKSRDWAFEWESDIAMLINSKELKTLVSGKDSDGNKISPKVKRIAQILKRNLIQVHIGFDGISAELRTDFGDK